MTLIEEVVRGRRQSRVRCWKPILGGGDGLMRGKFCGVGSDATSLVGAMTWKGVARPQAQPGLQ